MQILSAGLYITAVIALWREAGARFVREHLYFALIPVAMCLREADFHNKFTTLSITTTYGGLHRRSARETRLFLDHE